MAIFSAQLTAAETTICLAGASETRAVLSIIFCNTDTSDRTITVYAYASGGSAADNTTIIKSFTIPAGDTFIWSANEKFILNTGDKISGLADVTLKVTTTTNYYLL